MDVRSTPDFSELDSTVSSGFGDEMEDSSMDLTPTDMEDFAQALTSDRLIKVYVGPDSMPPFLVQESILCGASEYFMKVIRDGQVQGGEPGSLYFLIDDRETWKVLLFWVVKATLPREVCMQGDEALQLSLTKCWVAGDKYFVKEFQDVVMLELLKTLDRSNVTLEAAREGLLGSMPGSALRRLLAEELIYAFHKTHHIDPEDLNDLEGRVVGMSSSLQHATGLAVERYGRPSGKVGGRKFGNVSKRATPTSKLWTKFMVCTGWRRSAPVEL